jgi:LysR family transcriptional regulator, glycine cleavage system transcriptional activator
MPSRPPSLRAIAAFEAAARHQSFSKAAAELVLTQGAVSHAVSTLEKRLNAELFVRSGRQLRLTDAGRVLAGRVRLGLSLIGDAFETSPWLDRKTLRITAVPAFARRVMAPLLPSLRRRFKHIAVHLSSSWTLEEVGSDYDIGLRYGPGSWNGLSAEKLADETLVAVASSRYRHPLPAEPRALLKHDLIGHPEFPWSIWFDAAGIATKEPAVALSLSDSDMLIDAAVAGAGIALVRSCLAKRELQSGALVRLFDVKAPAPYAYWVVWNTTTPKASLIEEFRSWLRAELAAA